MMQTCTPDYREGAARPDLPSCGAVFDDVDRSTLCPHVRLGDPTDPGLTPTAEPAGVMLRYADLDDTGRYRYTLSRIWGPGPTLVFVMLNPSTADAEVDDPTIRRCIGYARREGCGAILVVNLYAARTTRPAHLFDGSIPDPVGSSNDHHIGQALRYATDTGRLVVCAWGAHPKISDRVKRFRELAEHYETDLVALRITTAGAPGHPLYLPADAPLVSWGRS